MSWPAISLLVPHTGPMCLLDRVLSHDERETVCAVRVDGSGPFRDARGDVPAWLGIEYLAQCIAAHAGLRARELGEAPQAGLFLGARRLQLAVSRLPAGAELRATAAHLRGSGTGLQTFACALLPRAGAPPWIMGNLNVMRLDRPMAAAEGPP